VQACSHSIPALVKSDAKSAVSVPGLNKTLFGFKDKI
jgi:hypothetical protein